MMSGSELALAVGFWFCAVAILYVYGVYPIVVWVLASLKDSLKRSPAELSDDLPTLTLLIAAYNEESVIAQRLRNALSMDYPSELFEVVVGLDGCSDGTAAILKGLDDRRVRVLEYVERRGKATVLNEAMAEINSEIVMMSDANTDIDPLAARQLVGWFKDPEVGAAVGRLILTDLRSGRNADGLYWKYETFLKRCEGRLGALLGANGAIYAIRRELYVPIPAETIIDDFVIPLVAKLRSGCAIVYDCDAIAREETPADVTSEFHRRARIGAGGFQSIALLWKLLDPRQGWVAFTFFCHKVLRWLCPFFMIGLLASNVVLCDRPFFQWVLVTQTAFYGVSLAAAFVPPRLRLPRTIRLMTMFTSMNAALLVGFVRWLRKRQNAAWKRTSRAVEATGALR
jgi:cellulose synthase/poly-beta-1,6-N-acetylglucosamine synthase-like glycosyltransferase